MGWFGLSKQEEMYWNGFMLGDKVDVLVESSVADIYSSRVEVVNPNEMWMQTPRLGNVLLETALSKKVQVNVYTENGIFRFKSKIVNFDKQKGYEIAIGKPATIERVQRRQFVRLNIILPIDYGVIPKDAKNLNAPIIMNNAGVTKNLSEGGMLVVIDRAFTSETLLKIIVKLSTTLIVEILGKVLEQKKLDMDNKFSTRIQFVRINEGDRDRIRKFVLSHAQDKTVRRVVGQRPLA